MDRTNTINRSFCGSGTIAACLIAQNIAPGFNREFVSEAWHIIPEDLYENREADQQADYDKEVEVYAYDIDPDMIEIAKRNAAEVGLSDIIQFEVKDEYTNYSS